MASGVIPLATLLDSLLQKSYHELTVLAELLPRKSDVDRKTEIVQFARRTRLQLVRLLALVKWAGSSDSVQKCSEMSELVSHQSWLYEDTANQLVSLARHQLLQACMPTFSLAPALDVLCTGSYPRLPTCIQDNIIPPSPLAREEAGSALSLLTITIRRRLLLENIPPTMSVKSIEKGLVTFEVPHEFTLSLSVVGEDTHMPWRLVHLKILVGHSLPGSPPLVHSRQQTYLTQLVQSHLVSPEAPLSEAFACLHTFCLSLQLDCLHSQALQLSSSVCGSYVKVDEYQPGRLLRVGYWCPNTQGLSTSAFLLSQRSGATWPKLVVMVDTSSPSHPLTCSHIPPLPEGGEGVGVNVEKLCLEEVIGACVRVRSRARLTELKNSLAGTVWEERAQLVSHPLALRVRVPVKCGESVVVIGVDGRMGHVVVGVEPSAKWEGVSRAVEETEKALITGSNLSVQLNHLQCQLFLNRLVSCTEELGLIVESSLPLSSPLLLPSRNVFYIRLLPMAYMIVCVSEEGGVKGEGRGVREGVGVVDSYYLVELAEANVQSLDEGNRQIPAVFYTPVTLVEIDGWKLLQNSLRAVVVKQNPALLKRKLRGCDHPLPSTKRLCVVRHLDFSPLPVLSCSSFILSQMKNSLKASGISGHQVLPSSHGCPCLSVCAFPLLEDENSDLHHHLSSLLLSCLVFPSSLGHKLVMVFSPLISVDQAPNIVLHQDLPLNFDLGQALLASWRSKLTFLSLALELLHYLQDPQWPLSLCSLSHFGYDSLTVSFGEHSLTVHGGMAGIQLSLPPDCPQSFLAEPLQRCLLTTRSLPILLKGIVGTEETTSLLSRFTSSFSGASLTATSPTQVQLQYDSLSLSMNLLTGSHVEFIDLLYTHQKLLSVPGTPSPLSYLKAFFHSFLGTDGPTELEDVATPLSRPPSNKPSLQPSPMPISSPSRNLWPSSPLPSIPQLPTPPSHPHHFTNISAWSYVASLEQFHSLVTTPIATPNATPISPLQSFLASLAQLCHFWHQAAVDRAQQPPGQLQFMSIDRGTYHYRTETLSASLSMEMSQTPSLQLAFRALREGSWSQPELQTMTDFFKKEVACPPYTISSIVSFVRLLQLPLTTLRSCVQLMVYHLNPPPGLPWQLTLCMTIPAGSGDEISQLKPGSPGVFFKGKLLLILQLTNTQDGQKALIPLLHDLKSNSTFASRHQSHLLSNVDAILKKVSQEHSKPNHPESSIFPAVRAVLSQPNLTS